MRALCWYGKNDVRVETVPDPQILNPRDAINYEEIGNTLDGVDVLREATAGQGPDVCIDAVGMEAHGVGLEWWYDRTKQAMMAETGRRREAPFF